MKGCGAEFPQGVSMGCGWITFVSIPGIIGIFLMKFEHVPVPSRFSQYRSRRDIEKSSVSFDKTVVGDVPKRFEFIPVYGNRFRGYRKLFQGKVHGLNGGLQDIYGIDGFGGKVHYRIA